MTPNKPDLHLVPKKPDPDGPSDVPPSTASNRLAARLRGRQDTAVKAVTPLSSFGPGWISVRVGPVTLIFDDSQAFASFYDAMEQAKGPRGHDLVASRRMQSQLLLGLLRWIGQELRRRPRRCLGAAGAAPPCCVH